MDRPLRVTLAATVGRGVSSPAGRLVIVYQQPQPSAKAECDRMAVYVSTRSPRHAAPVQNEMRLIDFGLKPFELH